ncbi:unnamed protein product [Rotaria sp. Silwood2]|nr:unnamed protein product [Rotaria sp. Silwood2]CAF4160543.1 unnamed protein product [Rotaria sp. Silwood2]
MVAKLKLGSKRAWFYCIRRRSSRQRRIILRLASNIGSIILFFGFLHIFLTSSLPPIIDQDHNSVHTSFDHLIPSDSFDLFWTMWNTDESTFRDRRLLVIDSLFIHHPQATVIVLSPTLNDTNLFLPYRQRGYQIYSINISLDRMIQWHWYVGDRSRNFLIHWNTLSTYFYSHMNDYVRGISLYLYGGTYIDMDILILQPLPRHEFIGFDRSDSSESCLWCVKNTLGLYLSPSLMRFRSRRKVLREILENTFDHQVYNESCFNCVGSKAFTEHIIQHRDMNDSQLINLKFFEPFRLYPFTWRKTLLIFHNVQKDASLQLADLMIRSYSLRFFGHISDQFSIVHGCLIAFLFDQLDLGVVRPKILNRGGKKTVARVIHLPLYIYTDRKQGRFLGRDVIYLRAGKRISDENVKWNISIHVSNGTIIYSNTSFLSNLNQAQINKILNEISYQPYESTSIDTLNIYLTTSKTYIISSLTIVVFSKWVTFLVKTMETSDQWSVIQRLVTSVETHYPQTIIHIASNLDHQSIYQNILLNLISSDDTKGYSSNKITFIYNIPENNGQSISYNYLVNATSTPFFFLINNNFTIEEYPHIDLLLELIYTYKHIDIIAGQTSENIEELNNFSSFFPGNNQTQELQHDISEDKQDQDLFIPSFDDKVDPDKTNPCHQVDFLPDVFMGRKESLRSIDWDIFFQSKEDEDFFIRSDQASRTVYTCQFI